MIMSATALLSVDAAIEGATGLALMAAPETVVGLVFGAAMQPIGTVLTRLAGIAIVSLALGSWLTREKSPAAGFAALFVYNFLSGAYLAILGIQGEFVGALLWPAVAVHVVFGLLIANALRRRLPEPGAHQ